LRNISKSNNVIINMRLNKAKICIFFIFILLFLPGVTLADSAPPKVLVVEDAHSDYGVSNSEIESYYTGVLDTIGLTYDTCTVSTSTDDGPAYDGQGGCSEDIGGMKNYDIVIWFTGNDYGNTLRPNDQTNISRYLDNGGRLFITGQDVGYDLVGLGNGINFYKNYLHAYYSKDDIDDYNLTGKSKEEIGDGLLIDISGGAEDQNAPSLIFYAKYDLLTTELYPENNSFYYGLVTDTIYKSGGDCYCGDTEIDKWLYCVGLNDYQGEYCVVADDGSVFHSKTQFKLPGAIKADTGGPNGYKVVYFGFGFEGIDDSSDRINVMNRTMNYLAGPRTENTKIYVRNLDNTTWEDLNITCDPSNSISKGGYCLREMFPKVNATCINPQLFGNITGAEFFVNSTGEGNGTNMSATDGNFNSSSEVANGNINVSNLSSEGVYIANVHCKDSDNYWGKFDNYTFEVDKTQPGFGATPIKIENGNEYTKKEKPKIETSSNNPVDTHYMAFSCNNLNWTNWLPYQQIYSNFNITYPNYGCSLVDGNRTVYVRIRDKAGNLGYYGSQYYASDWIVLDRTPSTINLISPSDNDWLNSTNVTFVFNFTDELSQGANCSLYIDGVLNQTNSSTSNSTNTNFSVSGLSEGQHAWNITCKDLAGNINSSAAVFSIDLTPPITEDDSNVSEPWYGSDQTIKLTCSDSGSGCNKTYYCIANKSETCTPTSEGDLVAVGWKFARNILGIIVLIMLEIMKQ
jgi:hypothetical protein